MYSARLPLSLLGTVAVLALALSVRPGHGQFRPGGRPPGVMPGQPGFNGGQPGFNPQPPGFNGGQPGFNGGQTNPFNPQPPGFTGQRPGINPPGMNPPGFPGGGNILIKTWTCTRCGAEMSRGTDAPPATCPNCHARIINGVGPAPEPAGNPFLAGGGPSSNSSGGSSSSGSGKGWVVVVLVVGISLVGIAGLLGGTFLMIVTMRSNPSSSRRRRDYDD